MKIISTEKTFEGKFINVFRKIFITKSEKEGIWEYVKYTNSATRAVIIFAMTSDREVILEKIFRVPREDYIIELPAGSMRAEGETEEEAARRELLEETGFSAKEMMPVFSSVILPGLTNLEAIYFFAPNVEFVGGQECDDEEEIEVVKVPLDNLVDFVIEQSKTGKIEENVLSILPILQRRGLI